MKPDGADDLTRRLNKPDADTHCKEAWEAAEPAIREQIDALLSDPKLALELDSAFARISQMDGDSDIQPFKRGLLLRLLFGCLIDADRTNTADFEKPVAGRFRQHGEYAAWSNLIDRLERKLAKFSGEGTVNALRQQISMHCLAEAERPRGIYTLTVPTGGGKTLGSDR